MIAFEGIFGCVGMKAAATSANPTIAVFCMYMYTTSQACQMNYANSSR